MPIKNRIMEMHAEITKWRRDFHENPELLYDTFRTSKIVSEKLNSFGCDMVKEGIGRTGVVAVIKGRSDSKGKMNGNLAGGTEAILEVNWKGKFEW